MPTHTLVYYGHLNTSFHDLHPAQDKTWTMDGTESAVELPDSATFNGIHFGFMQGDDGFYFVKVDNLCLQVPVLFIAHRHGPAAPGLAWSKLDNDVAAAILVDALVTNPGHRDLLGKKLRTLERN